ncbi:MAG: hypothetical protein K2X82_01935, partial [Gemmataceae bacterium]|nr:hypothetical protein [Gemmataceae bacterium]
MASLQQKGDGWYCQFVYKKQRHTFAVGKVDEAEARAVAAKVGYLLIHDPVESVRFRDWRSSRVRTRSRA